MGRRSRRRQADVEPVEVPTAEYRGPEGDVLVLRGVLTPATRREYAAVTGGSPLSREDAWQRAVEFLFERLAVRWELAGVPLSGQRELLARFRAASLEERASVRTALREHVAEFFPELEAP